MSAIHGAARRAGSVGRRGGDAPKLVALRSSAGVALIATTVLASAVGFLAASVVNVAIPAIGRDLGSGVSGLNWVLTGYLVTVVALLPLSGARADRLGRRRVVAAGLVVMLVGSALCAVAPTLATLIAARITQGAGGAMLVPSSLALLVGTLRASDRARRHRGVVGTSDGRFRRRSVRGRMAGRSRHVAGGVSTRRSPDRGWAGGTSTRPGHLR